TARLVGAVTRVAVFLDREGGQRMRIRVDLDVEQRERWSEPLREGVSTLFPVRSTPRAASSAGFVPGARVDVEEAPASPLPLWLLLGGATLSAVGAVVWGVQAGQLSGLEQDLGQRNASGKITGVSYGAASARYNGINNERAIALGSWGLGAAG